MRILNLRITLRASWVHSLKEKRSVVKSIIQRLKNKFNVSVGEVKDQDIHQSIVIGISAVCGDQKQVDSTLENLIDFIEDNTDAEIINIESDNYIFK